MYIYQYHTICGTECIIILEGAPLVCGIESGHPQRTTQIVTPEGGVVQTHHQGSSTDEGQHDFLPGFGCQGTKGPKKVSGLESIIEESPRNTLDLSKEVLKSNFRQNGGMKSRAEKSSQKKEDTGARKSEER